MTLSPLAGRPAPSEMLVDPARLGREYFQHRPDPEDPQQQISFGTSGHRGLSLRACRAESAVASLPERR